MATGMVGVGGRWVGWWVPCAIAIAGCDPDSREPDDGVASDTDAEDTDAEDTDVEDTDPGYSDPNIPDTDGDVDVEDVRIDPGVIDPDDPEMLADLVLAALRDVTSQVQDLQRGSIGGLDLGDVNLGGLGGLGGALGET